MPADRAINVAEIFRLRFRVQNDSIKCVELVEEHRLKRHQEALLWIAEAKVYAEAALDAGEINTDNVMDILAGSVTDSCEHYEEINF